MTNIHYKNKLFSIEDFVAHEREVRTNYYKSVSDFIDSWTKGKRTFEITTSGSTGKPKAIIFTKEQCIKSACQTIDIFGLKKNDNFLCCLDISYVAGFMMIIRALVVEANMYLTKAERNPFLKTDPNIKFDFAAFVPYQLRSIIEDNPQNIDRLNSMKAILVGGGTISCTDMKLFKDIKAPIYHTYGMTETLTHVALKRLNGENPDQYFKALPGVAFSIDSRDCLVIKTQIVSEEIITNDIVKLISDKEFEYMGRIDNIINSGGYKIHPQLVEQRVESVIKEIFNTSNYFIFPVEDQKFGMHPELMIEGEHDQSKLNKLTKVLKKILHPYEIPKGIHFRNKFVLTRSGKVDRGETMSENT
jgi:o-succinylbenzoate---CoA ligase